MSLITDFIFSTYYLKEDIIDNSVCVSVELCCKDDALVAFLGCAVIGVSQGDERPLMSKFSYCGHIRSYKQRCASN